MEQNRDITNLTNSKGILGEGVPPGSPDPSQTTKCYFLLPFSDQSSKIQTHLKGWSAIRGHGLSGEGNCCETKIILVHTSCCLPAKSGQTK